MKNKFEWKDKAPENDGDFFYWGPTPDGTIKLQLDAQKENIFAIVTITTLPQNDERYACLLIPPGWNGDKTRTMSVIHGDKLNKWTGQWAGPEFGLCYAMYYFSCLSGHLPPGRDAVPLIERRQKEEV